MIIRIDWSPVPAIVVAQAVTVLAAPLMAGTLWWLTSREDVMGEHRNGLGLNIAAGIAFLLLLGMAVRLAAIEIPKKLDQLRSASTVTQLQQPMNLTHRAAPPLIPVDRGSTISLHTSQRRPMPAKW